MGLVGFNKRFLGATVGAPGSTHDARLLRYTEIFRQFQSGDCLPDKCVNLGDGLGHVPLVTVGGSAFPRFSWLLKNFPNVTRDPKEKLFNQKLRSARVVAENSYGMLKGRGRLIYKEAVQLKVCGYVNHGGN